MRRTAEPDAYRDGLVSHELAGAGLTEVGIEVSPQYVGNGDTWQEMWQLFFDQVAPRLLDAGLLTLAELRAGLELFDTPGFVDMPLAYVATWGRKPTVD